MSFPEKARNFQPDLGKVFPDGMVSPIGSRAFALVIAGALRREFGSTHSAIKTVGGLVGANERSVKNWFSAKNGPSGEHLVDLARHSDDVLEAVLFMAGREEMLKAKKLGSARQKLSEILAILDDLQSPDASTDR